MTIGKKEMFASNVRRGGHQDITLEERNQKYTHVDRRIRRVSKGYNVLRIASFKRHENQERRKRDNEEQGMTRKTNLLISQKNQIIRRRNAGLSARFSSLPPSAADIRYFKNLVLGEADLVGVFGVRVV